MALCSLLFRTFLILWCASSIFSLLNDALEIFSAFLINEWFLWNFSKIYSNSFKCSNVNHSPFICSFNFSYLTVLNISCSMFLGSSICCNGTASSSTSSLLIILTIKFFCPITSTVVLNSLSSSCFISWWLILFTSSLIIWWNWSSSSFKKKLMIRRSALQMLLNNRKFSEILHTVWWWWINRRLDSPLIGSEEQYLIYSLHLMIFLSCDHHLDETAPFLPHLLNLHLFWSSWLSISKRKFLLSVSDLVNLLAPGV